MLDEGCSPVNGSDDSVTILTPVRNEPLRAGGHELRLLTTSHLAP
jgi:hypothetical protein